MTAAALPTLYPPLVRSMPVADMEFDGSTLEALFVPWDTPTTVWDDEPEPYEEGFRRGAFDAQIERYPSSVHDVALIPRHGSTEMLGTTRSLTNTDAGLHGVVGVLPSRRADVAAMVEMGVDSVSIEFHPLQRNPRAGLVRWRDRAFLRAVALVATPAYPDARVLALRAEQTVERERADRLARLAALDADVAAMRAAGERWRT